MAEPTNLERAEWAYAALKAFARKTRQDTSGDLKHDEQCVLQDLLCDLQHLADRDGMDFDQALDFGRACYIKEVI